VDVHPSNYFYTYRFLEGCLKQLETATSSSGLLPFNVMEDCQWKNSFHMLVKPASLLGLDPELDNWSAAQQTTPADNRFLGRWENLFVKNEHPPDFLNWDALTWLGKDFGNQSDILTHSVEALISGEAYMRVEGVPHNVQADPKHCQDCKRRFLWRADAKLDTVWYNWPIVEGNFDTMEHCVQSYYRFFFMHKDHLGPVCFRAAVFCRVLAHWCKEFAIIIDPRLGARQAQDGQIYAKIKYLSARKIRIFELMCLTQFLAGAHNVLIDEVKGNRYAMLEKFLDSQKNGEFAYRRQGYQRLHKEMDAANDLVHRRGVGQLYKMPLEWKDQHTTYRKDRMLGDASSSLPSTPMGTHRSQGAGPSARQVSTSPTKYRGSTSMGKPKK
jgi:hypothetical protein